MKEKARMKKRRETRRNSKVFPCVSVQAWSDAYGVRPYIAICLGCGRNVEVSTPVAFDSWRGFESGIHEPCGEEYRVCKVISISPEIRQTMKDAFGLL